MPTKKSIKPKGRKRKRQTFDKRLVLAALILIGLLGLVVAGLAPAKTAKSTGSQTKTEQQSTASSTKSKQPKAATPTNSSDTPSRPSSSSSSQNKQSSNSGSTQTNNTAPVSQQGVAAPVFTPTASVSKIFEEITACVRERYIFSGQITANMAGTVNWNWLRWDGGTSGVSGTVTFDSNGNTNDAMPSYDFWIHPNYDVSGWVALQLTWSGGNYTTPHSNFTYVDADVNPGGCP